MVKRGRGNRSSSSRHGGGRKSSGSGKFRGGPRRDGRDHQPRQFQIGDAEERTLRDLQAWLKPEPKRPPPPGGYPLDDWQEEAFRALQNGDSVIVDAPTTAGKTRVVEAFFEAEMDHRDFRAAYTTPVKSLANDKVREFREKYGSQNVGIATGDLKENLNAPIVVTTLETYRNSLLGVEPDLGRKLVVFDEYHYLQDVGRGSAWEEAMILTPPSCQLLLLSASVANAEEFQAWLKELRGGNKVDLIRTLERPVPLTHMIYINGKWISAEHLPGGVFKHLDKKRMALPPFAEDIAESVLPLPELGLTPAILYCGKRLAVEGLAKAIQKRLDPIDEDQRKRIGDRLKQLDEELSAMRFIKPDLRNMIQTYGTAFHHSGLAAPARMAIESLLKDGMLRFCVSTMGLSLGINFAVRSALIADYQRPSEEGLTTYPSGEILQMLGRAGRRGSDKVGFSLWASKEAYKKFGQAKREVTISRLKTDPATFLGLVGRGYSMRAVEGFYDKSFYRYRVKGADYTLITKKRVQKKLQKTDMPCNSVAEALAAYFEDQNARPCVSCAYRKPCHAYVDAKLMSPLAALHLHLHYIHCLDEDEKLTDFGSLARYFPQSGGLLLAFKIADGEIKPENMAAAAQLAACLSTARFKEPAADPKYKLPFDQAKVEDDISYFYPEELFPEAWDDFQGRRQQAVVREFQPAAGYVVKTWLEVSDWRELVRECASEKFGEGDLINLLYRVSTYLQSIAQSGVEELKEPAMLLRKQILRSPLDFGLQI